MIKERQWKSIASFQYTTINSVFIQAHKTIQYIKAKNMIIDYLETENNDRITSAKIQEMCGFTKQQARSTIDKMRSEGILDICKHGKNSYYVKI